MRPLHIPFTKMQGAGNDFIVLDNRFLHLSEAELAELARWHSPRRFGVGSDGLLALDPPRRPEADYRMRFYNPDGSAAGMCGNGARCLARFARQAGLAGNPLVFDADAGEYSAVVPADARAPVRLFVPPPRGFREVEFAGGYLAHYVWTGTHHVVLLVDDADASDPSREAPPIRHDPQFRPEGANVNFVEVLSEAAVRVRTFEKGVEAETLACGTGALAAAVVARLTRRLDVDLIEVRTRGGALAVGMSVEDAQVTDLFLEGPAETTFSGVLTVDPATMAPVNAAG